MISFCDAFISYGRADSLDFGRKLYARLLEEGFKIWFDQNDIPLGVDFQNQIDDGIEKAHNFLFIIAPHSVNSPYCLKEIELAIKRNKRIIPLLHVEQISQETWQQRFPHGTPEDWEAYKAQGKHTVFQNMHPTIGKINWVYFREGIDDFEKSFAGLIDLLKRHADYIEQHTRFLVKALEWERHQKSHSCLLIGDEKQEAQDWLNRRFKDEQPPCVPSDLHCEYITESIKNANNLMTQVIISYANEDRATMEKIRNSLRRESITVWTNTTDIQTGEAFEEAIKRGIEQADNVVYLLSPDSVNSYFARKELDYALSLNKRIIPVLVREISSEPIPNALRDLQYIDLTDNVKEEDYHLDESQLLRILHQDEAYYNEHKVLLTKALKWKQQHENPSILLRGYNLRSAETWLKVANKRTLHPPILLIEEFINESLRQPPAISLDVFISYSRADSDFARKLNDELQLQGKTTWFDQESIASGADFAQEICQGIQACDNFLFILSPRSVNSPYCTDEVEYAAQLNKRFVTVLHRQVNSEELHPELRKVQWIDFKQNQGDFQVNFRQLVRTLDTDREHLRNHTKWSQRAIEWKEKDKSADLLLRGNEFAIAENWFKEAEQYKKQPASTPLQKDYITASREAIATARKQQKRQVLILRSLLGLVSTVAVIAVGLGMMAVKHQQDAQRDEIEALQESSEARLALDQQFDALRLALKAAKKLKAAGWAETDTRLRAEVVSRLQQSIYLLQEGNRLEGHEGGVSDVKFSPDGQTITTVGRDKTVKVWRTDGTLLSTRTFENSDNLNGGGIFSPNGQIIATATRDQKVKLWRVDGTLLSTLEDKRGLTLPWMAVNEIFSPDSQTIATYSNDNKTVQLWRMDGTLLSILKDEGLSWFGGNYSRFSPDGQTIATVSYDKLGEFYRVKLWNRDGTSSSTLKGHEQSISDVSFSPDGQIIATASEDKTVKLWQRNGTLIATLQDHDKGVQLVKFSPDGQIIATASEDKTVKLWQRNGTLVATLKSHKGNILDVSFSLSERGQTIATASTDNTVKLWQLDGTPLATLSGHNDWARKVIFSPVSKMLVSVSDDGIVRLWKQDNPLHRAIESANSPNFFMDRNRSWQPWGQTFATMIENGSVRLWKADGTRIATPIKKSQGDVDVKFFNKGESLVTIVHKDKEFYGPVQLWKADGTLIKTLIEKTQSKGSVDVSVSNNGQTIVTSINDKESYGSVQLWKADGTFIKTLIEKTQSKRSVGVSLSNNGQTIATTIYNEDSDGPVQLWKADGTPIRTLIEKTQSKGSVDVSLSNDGQTIATTIYNEDSYGPVQLWKTDGTFIKTLIEKSKWASVTFSDDNRALVTRIRDDNSYYSAKLWKNDGTFVTTLIEKAQGGMDVMFSPDNQKLVTTVNDGSIKLWKTDGTLVSTPIRKSKGFWYITSFSPDNRTIALANQKTIKLLNLDGTTRDIQTGHNAGITTAIFSPDSQMIASASWDSTIKLWKRDGTLISTLSIPVFKAGVTSLNFSADGKRLTSVDNDNRVIVRSLEGMTKLDELVTRGCQWMAGYLKSSPNLEKSERTLCDSISKQ